LISKILGVIVLLGSFASGWVPVAGFSEYGNEHSGSIKDLEFFYKRNHYQLLKKE
jgi:hypothetical protein